ncbi:50S ribosomal protein L10 [Thermoflavimicrobium daqui]|jgi:large subunit ribosomal protein L10|uniref:Large ribosomal subunit protein uL10 n=1 Tax=Thermoflavimicrobium daqui TaxID=2137476 RepID=A0A364K323_9BACL|nr:50S ribosomal protein L10 [Thermoflavimicrobium daqui]RAL23237.1 50S ribosomal protein L10 [Thermoflavimicrobium daqui]
MSKAIELKKQKVAEIVEKLSNSKSTILTDYRGLTVAESNELRKQLREAGVEFYVLKNTLTRRASAEVGYTELEKHLTGPTAVAFSNDDVVAPAKVLYQFAKDHEALKIKAGVVEGNVVDVEAITELAQLPSREGLLSMLLSVLQAPMRQFALAVKAVAEKNEEGAPAQEA